MPFNSIDIRNPIDSFNTKSTENMPTIMLPLPEVQESVIRPIVYSVVDDIKKITNINIPTPIYFPGDVKKMHQSGSTVDGDNRDPVLASQRQLYVEAEDNYADDYIATVGALYNPEHPPIFVDPILGVTIVPIYVTSTIKIQLRFKTQSKTEATKWRDDIIVKTSRSRVQNMHIVTYHYSMPEIIEDILYAVYERREKIEGYGQSASEYLISNATSRLTLIGDIANKTKILAIKERQTRIMGMFDFDIAPDKNERDENTGTWIATMSYSFNYSRPTEISIQYPVIVHNQLMPEKYTMCVFDNPSMDRSMYRQSQSLYALSMFESMSILDNSQAVKPVYHVPEFDLFEPKTVPYGTETIFIALCCLDLPNKRHLLNLNHIDPFVISKPVMDYISGGGYLKITKLYRSIYQLQLYKDNELYVYDVLECDSLGNVVSTVDLSPRHTYRVRFSVVTDLTLVPPDEGGGGGDDEKKRKTAMLQSVIAYRKSDLEQ